jgi:hypothetical protein
MITGFVKLSEKQASSRIFAWGALHKDKNHSSLNAKPHDESIFYATKTLSTMSAISSCDLSDNVEELSRADGTRPEKIARKLRQDDPVSRL